MFFFYFLCLIFSVTFCVHRPVVILHGLASCASDMQKVEQSIINFYPGVHTLNLVLGNNERTFSSTVPIRKQAKEAWLQILNDRVIMNSGEFDVVGHSQGTMVLRTLVEEFLPLQNEVKIVNFVSLSGPLNGVFCGKESSCKQFLIPDEYREFIIENAYKDEYQNSLAPSNYWKSPYTDQYEEMMNSMALIPELDNLKNYQEYRKKGFTSLKSMICIFSKVDGIITPYYSSKWDYFVQDTDNQSNVSPMEEQEIYVKDTFGLRTLHQRGGLKFIEYDSNHMSLVNAKGVKFLEKNVWAIME